MVLNTRGCSSVCSASASTFKSAKGTRIFSSISTTSIALHAANPLNSKAFGLKPPPASISIFEASLYESKALPLFQIVVVFIFKCFLLLFILCLFSICHYLSSRLFLVRASYCVVRYPNSIQLFFQMDADVQDILFSYKYDIGNKGNHRNAQTFPAIHQNYLRIIFPKASISSCAWLILKYQGTVK